MTEKCSAATTESTPTFLEIQAILDHLVLGKEADLKLIHGDHFDWSTKALLLAAYVERSSHQYPLIDGSLINNGRGNETNLVRILTAGITLDGRAYPRMPYRGNIDDEYATPEQLTRITLWIDSNCPD
ncbi:MAG: hypothetical protein V4719_15630 [Planctomycetota bacterium]